MVFHMLPLLFQDAVAWLFHIFSLFHEAENLFFICCYHFFHKKLMFFCGNVIALSISNDVTASIKLAVNRSFNME